MIKTLFATVLLFLALSASAGNYLADQGHSLVGFGVKYMMLSKVRGQFNDYKVEITMDEKDLTRSSVKAAIKTASVTTLNEKRDGHLKSGDFFDIQNHPEMTFQSKKIVKKGAGFEMTGNFTLRGVTKEITFPFHLEGPKKDNWGNTRIGAEAILTINRKDYGVSWNQTLDSGGYLVHDDVEIELFIDAILQK